MCEPVSIALGTVAAASAVTSGVTGYIANQNSADAQRAIAAENEKQSTNAADDAIQRGEVDAANIDRKADQIIGRGKVTAAANNVDVSTGSTARAFTDSAMMAALDKETVRNNAKREAWGYKVKGLSYRAEGEAAASAAEYASYDSILSGVAGAASAGASAFRSVGAYGSAPVLPKVKRPGID